MVLRKPVKRKTSIKARTASVIRARQPHSSTTWLMNSSSTLSWSTTAPAPETVGRAFKALKPKVEPPKDEPKNPLTLGFDASCCGVRWLTHFGEDDLKNLKSEEDVRLSIKKFCDDQRAIYMVALNDGQVKKFDKVLKEGGFHVIIKDAYHPNYADNDITIYARIQHSQKSKDGKPVELCV